ncbi:MAG: hypothetical protein ABIU77_27745 [Ferruginibacter sp.]
MKVINCIVAFSIGVFTTAFAQNKVDSLYGYSVFKIGEKLARTKEIKAGSKINSNGTVSYLMPFDAFILKGMIVTQADTILKIVLHADKLKGEYLADIIIEKYGAPNFPEYYSEGIIWQNERVILIVTPNDDGYTFTYHSKYDFYRDYSKSKAKAKQRG